MKEVHGRVEIESGLNVPLTVILVCDRVMVSCLLFNMALQKVIRLWSTKDKNNLTKSVQLLACLYDRHSSPWNATQKMGLVINVNKTENMTIDKNYNRPEIVLMVYTFEKVDHFRSITATNQTMNPYPPST